MTAQLVRGGVTTTIHFADLFEPCSECGVVHHEDVITVTTPDEWFPPLPARQRLASIIATAWRNQ